MDDLETALAAVEERMLAGQMSASESAQEGPTAVVTADEPRQRYEFHEIANCWPLVEGSEFDELVSSIRQHGLLQPIVLYESKILDGRNRYRAALEAGVEPRFTQYEGKDPIGFAEASNDARRHLNESQRAMVANRIAIYRRGANQHANEDAPRGASSKTQAEAAERFDVGRRQVQRARVVQEKAIPEVIKAVDAGKLPVATAAKLTELPAEEQAAIAAKINKGLEAPAAIREVKREVVRANLENVEVQEAKALEGVYDVVVVDPPWPVEKIEQDERPDQSEMDYRTMSLKEIGDLKLPTADDCHVWIWATQKHLPSALWLAQHWKLDYVCTFCWKKPGGYQVTGLPQYNCEFAVYARRGTPSFLDTKQFFTCFEAPRGAHSEKPELFYEVLRRVTAGRRADMFNRRVIEGFDGWGQESPTAPAPAAEAVEVLS